MEATLIEKEQDFFQETTRYWFHVEFDGDFSDDSGTYGVTDCGINGLRYVDCDGVLVDQRLVQILRRKLIITDEMRNDY